MTYKEVYFNYFGYDAGSFIPCEITGGRYQDIHHISCKGMGGSKKKDTIDNLMALTRQAHVFYGDKKKWKDWLKMVHNSFLETQTPWLELHPDCEEVKLMLCT